MSIIGRMDSEPRRPSNGPRMDSEDSLDVPEEPVNDDEDEDGSTLTQAENAAAADAKSTHSVMSFLTAVRIARWMARAYGYVAKKRKAYLNHNPVSFFFNSTWLQLTSDFLKGVASKF
jgi:hypothetical protein